MLAIFDDATASRRMVFCAPRECITAYAGSDVPAALAAIAQAQSRGKYVAGWFAYELGYFWGLGGTLQGLITPDIAYDFPDPQFIFFAINHAGIITALLYLTFTGQRPRLVSLPRVAAATILYALVAGLADYLLGTDYGFLAAKPRNPSLLDFLAPWPWYIPELVLIGLASLLIYYVPFLLLDMSRGRRRA